MVIKLIWAKDWKELITLMINRKKRVGEMQGRVMERCLRKKPAPSSEALS